MFRYLTEPEIGQKVIALVDRARKDYGIVLGCSGTEACRRIGLALRRGTIPLDADGMLVDKTVIINHTVTFAPRIEFTIFHEIVHFLLNEDGELIEYFTTTLRNDTAAYQAEIESCCHRGAAEFLMPQERVRETILADGLSAALVESIAEHHGASIIAAAIQVATITSSACYVVICCYSRIPGASSLSPGLFIEYAPASYSVKYPLARFTPVPDDHLLFHVWETGVPAEGRSYIPFRSGKRQPCHCQAVKSRGRVIGILRLQAPPPPEQLGLPL